MKIKKNKRLLKILLITTIILVVATLGVEIWFKQNARRILKNYITEQSRGKIKLELSKLDLNLFKNRLQIKEADLVSTDSLNQPITYHVTFRKLTLRVASVWKLLFKNQLLLDSIKLHDPIIEVIQWRKDTSQIDPKDELSIPQEMGKVYRSMYNALDEFGIKRILINNAKITLINKMKPGSIPVSISKIFFDLARLQPVKNGNPLIRNEQTLELKTSNQDIAMPGGRHRLSFASFKLKLLQQRIELDSCTVTAVSKDSSKSNYQVFFKKLFLSGVDFNAMSTMNTIKADSVYCENPYFHFDLHRATTIKKKKEIPGIQKIISDLSGNLDIAYVGIKNAGIHIDIHGKTKRSFVNSNKDNFEMKGFRINPDSSKPIAVQHFEMTLRNYLLYNEDSSSVYSFDHLLLQNTKIALSNFTIKSNSGHNKIRNDINISVPYFQLADLDWSQLIFDQKLSAKDAILINPAILFKQKKTASSGKKINLFSALENINSQVSLNNLIIKNGLVKLQLSRDVSFNVENLHLSVKSNKLLGSFNRKGLRSAVEKLSFTQGILQLKNLTAELQNAKYAGNNQVYADKISLFSKNNSIRGILNKVFIDNLFFDDAKETIKMNGLQWGSASLKLTSPPTTNKTNTNNSIYLRNIYGKNTSVIFRKAQMGMSTFIHSLQIASLIKDQKDNLRIDGLNVTGNELILKNNTLDVSAKTYDIGSNKTSYLHRVLVQQRKGRDSLYIQSTDVSFALDINHLLQKDIHLADLHASSPVITLKKWDTHIIDSVGNQQSAIIIDRLTTTEPDLYIATHRNDSVTILHIPSSDKSIANATGISFSGDGVHIEGIKFNTTSATFTKKTGEKSGIEKGKITIEISDINFGRKEGKNNWNALIHTLNLQDDYGLRFSNNKSKLSFNQASLGNLHLSSDYLPDFSKLMKANLSTWLHIPTGNYIDSITSMSWHNAKYNNSNRTFFLDSFNYHPTLSLDSVSSFSPYELDYITIKSGPSNISGLDAEKYITDSSFVADTVTITDGFMKIYRDKLPPSSPDRQDKELPTGMIKNIKIPVAVKSVQIKNGTIIYEEKNEKSRKEGTLSLTKLNGLLENIKNQKLTYYDSLSLLLNGMLMDSAHVSISLKESYTDTLNTFVLNISIQPTPFSTFNSLLVPLSNIKLASGTLDSLTMQVIGRNDIALGEMKMHYHGLSVQLVKDGDPAKSTLIHKVASFLLNTFLIKRNNNSHTGVVYCKRQSTQSFPNYIVKMMLSGVTSTLGIKKNRKYMKEYQKVVTKSGLQPLK